jgi:hypothetical protein
VVFIESIVFTRRLQQLAAASAPEVLQQVQTDLIAEPERGPMVKGLGGLRKARVANPGRGKGKRGGFRYLYVYLERKAHVHLLFLLDKDEQEDLDDEQRKQISALVKQLKG